MHLFLPVVLLLFHSFFFFPSILFFRPSVLLIHYFSCSSSNAHASSHFVSLPPRKFYINWATPRCGIIIVRYVSGSMLRSIYFFALRQGQALSINSSCISLRFCISSSVYWVYRIIYISFRRPYVFPMSVCCYVVPTRQHSIQLNTSNRSPLRQNRTIGLQHLGFFVYIHHVFYVLDTYFI